MRYNFRYVISQITLLIQFNSLGFFFWKIFLNSWKNLCKILYAYVTLWSYITHSFISVKSTMTKRTACCYNGDTPSEIGLLTYSTSWTCIKHCDNQPKTVWEKWKLLNAVYCKISLTEIEHNNEPWTSWPLSLSHEAFQSVLAPVRRSMTLDPRSTGYTAPALTSALT